MGLYELVEDVGSGEVDGDAGEKIYGRCAQTFNNIPF